MREVDDVVRVRALGWKAAQALTACAGRVRPLPEFAASPYRLAGGVIVWLGTGGPMHPRAVFVDELPDDAILDSADATAWTAPSPALAAAQLAAMTGALCKLMPAIAVRAGDRGFAPLLAGRRPAFPLAARSADALRAADAARSGDAGGFARSAARLLGVGGGLTPSGDDFVGGALFAIAHVRSAEPEWSACAASICTLARARTHSISVALLADLAAGASFAPLHDLVDAAARKKQNPELMRHIDAIAGIGHSSGWDMLTGFMAVVAGLPADASNTQHLPSQS